MYINKPQSQPCSLSEAAVLPPPFTRRRTPVPLSISKSSPRRFSVLSSLSQGGSQHDTIAWPTSGRSTVPSRCLRSVGQSVSRSRGGEIQALRSLDKFTSSKIDSINSAFWKLLAQIQLEIVPLKSSFEMAPIKSAWRLLQ